MGTYTTNYNLFMPTVGEQGWGELVNGNFSTIDATMKSLSNRTTTLETNVANINNRLLPLEENINIESGGVVSVDYVKAQKVYVVPELSSEHGDFLYATNSQTSTSIKISETYTTSSNSSTISPNMNYTITSYTYPLKLGPGVYIENSSDLVVPQITSVTANLRATLTDSENWARFYKNGTLIQTISGYIPSGKTVSVECVAGDSLYCKCYCGGPSANYSEASITFVAKPDLYIW